MIEISFFGGVVGSGLDASSLIRPAGVFPSGLGLGIGMGPLHAQALMNMGLMASVHNGNGPQFHGLQLGMSSMWLSSCVLLSTVYIFFNYVHFMALQKKNCHHQTITGCALETPVPLTGH